MNIYVQDEMIPIWIFLQFSGMLLKFPINPQQLKIDIPSESESVEVEGVGEVSTPATPQLARIQIDSMFWHQNNLVPSVMYVNWLKFWQKSKVPARLIVTRLNYNYVVTCENFSHWINAGEEKDTYFSLSLKEYREHKATILKTTEAKPKLIDSITQIADYLTLPVLMELPPLPRDTSGKLLPAEKWTSDKDTTWTQLSKEFTGYSNRWKEIFNLNKDKADENGTISKGTELTIPDDWVDKDKANMRDMMSNLV